MLVHSPLCALALPTLQPAGYPALQPFAPSLQCAPRAAVRMDAGNAIADAMYIVAALAVVGFAGRSVFDSIFVENEEFKPPKEFAGKNPFGASSA